MKPRPWEIGYGALVVTLFGLCLIPVYIQATRGDWHDFDVFYGAARAVLAGGAIHTISGSYQLPFWYPPWIAWAFIPFAFLTRPTALLLYQAASFASAAAVIHCLARHYNPRIRILDELFMLAMAIPMGFQVLIVGQVEYIFLALIVGITFAASQRKDVLVGLLFPFLLAKPHLVLLFTPFLFWRAGKRSLLVSLGFIAAMLMAASVLRPGWHLEMLEVLRLAGPRTDGLRFTTLAGLLGRQENWAGTANLPIALILTSVGLVLLWRVRLLPTVPLLSLALAFSLLVAPRAYAYDLPLLIPTLIWLTAERFLPGIWIWILAALIPLFTGYESGAYLLSILVCGLGFRRALTQTSADIHQQSRPKKTV
jgi:hypothetical protein